MRTRLSFTYKGKEYKRNPWGKETGDYGKSWHEILRGGLCGDCGVDWGKYHDSDSSGICDVEQCPICKEQLLSCGHGPIVFPGYKYVDIKETFSKGLRKRVFGNKS